MIFLWASTLALLWSGLPVATEAHASDSAKLPTTAPHDGASPVGEEQRRRAAAAGLELHPPKKASWATPQWWERVCADTFELCDPKQNSDVARIVKSLEAFNEIADEVDSNPELGAFKQSHAVAEETTDDEGKKSTRYVVKGKDADEYWTKRNAMVGEKIYTPERRRIATRYFDQAKKAVLAVLEDRRRLMEGTGDSAKLKQIDQMMDEIRETDIYFGTPRRKNGFKDLIFNIDARSKHSDEDGTTKNLMAVEGVILLVDQEPEAFYRMALHELGHIIGPRAFSRAKDHSDYSFDLELACLARPDSAGVNQNKLEEAFADHIATDAYAKGNQFPPGDDTIAAIQRFVAIDCLNYPDRGVDDDDPHPSSSVRLGSIAFAHPEIAKALPCLVDKTHELTSVTAPPLPKGHHAYCGPKLYYERIKGTR